MEKRSKIILYNFPLLLLAFLTVFSFLRFIFIFFFKAAFEPEFIFQFTPLHIITSMGYEPRLFLSLVIVVLNTYLHLNPTIKNIKYSYPLTLCMVGGIGLGFLTKEATIEVVPNTIVFGVLLLSIILDHKRTLDYPGSLKTKTASLPDQTISTAGRPKPRVTVAGASPFFARLPKLKINKGGIPRNPNVNVRKLGLLRRHQMRTPAQAGYPQGSPQTYKPRYRSKGQLSQPQTDNMRATYSDMGGASPSAFSQGSAREGPKPINMGYDSSSIAATTASSWDRERPSEPTRNVKVTPGANEGVAQGKVTRYVEKKVYIEGPSGIEERTVRIPVAPDIIPKPIKGGDKMVKISEEIIDANGKKMIVTKELPAQVPTTISTQKNGELIKEEKSIQNDISKKDEIDIPEVQTYFDRVQKGLEALANTIETLFKKIQFPSQSFVTAPETTFNRNWIKKEKIGESMPSFVSTSSSVFGERPIDMGISYPSNNINMKRRNSIREAQNILKKLEHKVENLERLYQLK